MTKIILSRIELMHMVRKGQFNFNNYLSNPIGFLPKLLNNIKTFKITHHFTLNTTEPYYLS